MEITYLTLKISLLDGEVKSMSGRKTNKLRLCNCEERKLGVRKSNKNKQKIENQFK